MRGRFGRLGPCLIGAGALVILALVLPDNVWWFALGVILLCGGACCCLRR